MLRINRMTDYAILVLGLLHQREDRSLNANDIATDLQLNKTTIAKVIKALVAAGLVNTSRGINGGCQLAVDVKQISLASVIEAVEGPIALTACVSGADQSCEVSNGCFMSGHWDQVNSAIRSALESVSLLDLFNPDQAFRVHQDESQVSHMNLSAYLQRQS